MTQNLKAPKLRFPGFTDDWEQRKVSEITTSYSGGTPKSGTAEYYDGNIPFIRSGEIYSNNTELFITELGLNNSSAKMVHVGDILYALYGATSGEVSRAKLDGAINQAILAVLPNEEINADFLVEWFRKEKENIIATYLQGGQGNLSAQIIKDLMVDIPSSGEQKKIGDYFTNLNNLITLHQRKFETLKKLKKGFLQKMFPQNGEIVPEIRFPGFTDAWEQRKVFDIANRYDNLRVPVAANLRVKGTTPYYGANGIQDYVLGFTHEGEFILVAEDGANDLQNYPVNYVNGRIWVNNHAHVLQGKESIAHNRFLSYSISKANIESVLVGGGRAKLNAEVMMNLDLMLPSYDEQEKIGKYFSNLDNLITLHQRKLDTLKKLKQGMLQQMFI